MKYTKYDQRFEHHLGTPLQDLYFIGPLERELLHCKGLHTMRDLWNLGHKDGVYSLGCLLARLPRYSDLLTLQDKRREEYHEEKCDPHFRKKIKTYMEHIIASHPRYRHLTINNIELLKEIFEHHPGKAFSRRDLEKKLSGSLQDQTVSAALRGLLNYGVILKCKSRFYKLNDFKELKEG